MKNVPLVCFVVLLILGLLIPGAAAVSIVTTMPNIWDVTRQIGGDHVDVIYVAPPTSVHISSDTIDALLQQNSGFLKTADIFLGQGGGMDKAPLTKVDEFRQKNFGLSTPWLLISNVSTADVPNATSTYDNPVSLAGYSEAVCWLLKSADPANATAYDAGLAAYLEKVSRETSLSAQEKETLATVPIICQFRIKNQAVTWLGMNDVDAYPQPHEMQTIIDDIHANPDTYRSIAAASPAGKIFVVENIVAGESMGVGIHEALKDAGVPAERVVFLNLPKSADGIDTILDYYAYNKNLILDHAVPAPVATEPAKSPVGIAAVFAGVLGASLLIRRE